MTVTRVQISIALLGSQPLALQAPLPPPPSPGTLLPLLPAVAVGTPRARRGVESHGHHTQRTGSSPTLSGTQTARPRTPPCQLLRIEHVLPTIRNLTLGTSTTPASSHDCDSESSLPHLPTPNRFRPPKRMQQRTPCINNTVEHWHSRASGGVSYHANTMQAGYDDMGAREAAAPPSWVLKPTPRKRTRKQTREQSLQGWDQNGRLRSLPPVPAVRPRRQMTRSPALPLWPRFRDSAYSGVVQVKGTTRSPRRPVAAAAPPFRTVLTQPSTTPHELDPIMVLILANLERDLLARNQSHKMTKARLKNKMGGWRHFKMGFFMKCAFAARKQAVSAALDPQETSEEAFVSLTARRRMTPDDRDVYRTLEAAAELMRRASLPFHESESRRVSWSSVAEKKLARGAPFSIAPDHIIEMTAHATREGSQQLAMPVAEVDGTDASGRVTVPAATRSCLSKSCLSNMDMPKRAGSADTADALSHTVRFSETVPERNAHHSVHSVRFAESVGESPKRKHRSTRIRDANGMDGGGDSSHACESEGGSAVDTNDADADDDTADADADEDEDNADADDGDDDDDDDEDDDYDYNDEDWTAAPRLQRDTLWDVQQLILPPAPHGHAEFEMAGGFNPDLQSVMGRMDPNATTTAEFLNKTYALPAWKEDAYGMVFNALNKEKTGKIGPTRVCAGLKAICGPSLTDAEIDYVADLLDITRGLTAIDGVDIHQFRMAAALAENIIALEPHVRAMIDRTKLTGKKEKAILLFCIDADQNCRMELDDLSVLLDCGSTSPELKYLILNRLRDTCSSISFLEFLAYMPLFIGVHDDIFSHTFGF